MILTNHNHYIRKICQSLIIPIPISLVRQVELDVGTEIYLYIKNDDLIISKISVKNSIQKKINKIGPQSYGVIIPPGLIKSQGYHAHMQIECKRRGSRITVIKKENKNE